MPADKIARAVLELATDNTKFNQGVDQAVAKSKSGADAILKQFTSVGQQLTNAGKMLAPLSVALAGVGAGILAVGVAFDSAFDTIRIGTGATGDALESLKGSFRAVLAGVPDDADKVAKALAGINTRLGLTGKPLEDLTTQLLTLSRITKTDINELIPAATRVFGDWNIATDKQGSTLDYLFKVSQSTGVGITTLMQKTVESGAAFKALGFNLDQSAALLGSWEKNGINADTMMSGLQKAATSFAKANIPVAEGLQTVVDKMLALGPGTDSAKLATQVFGKAAIGMSDAIFKGQLNVDGLVKSIDASKETIRGAAADTDDFGEQWGKFKNQILLALEPLGGRLFGILNRLMPLIEELVGHVSDAAKWFGELPDSVQATGVALVALGAGAGPALFAIGYLASNLPAVVEGIKATRVALVALSTNPYVLAITGLAAAFVILKGEVDKANANVARLEERQRLGANATKVWAGAIDGAGNALIDLNHLTDQQKAIVAGATGSIAGLGVAISLAAGTAQGATTDIGGLTGANERLKKAAEEAAAALKLQQDFVQHSRDVLKSFGISIQDDVTDRIGDFEEGILLAVRNGRTFDQAIAAMLPKMIQFADDAEKSGLNVGDLRTAIVAFQARLAPGLPTLNALVSTFDPTKPIGGLKAMTGETFAMQQQALRTRTAFEYFGIQLPADLKKAAGEAMTEFINLGQSGQATPKQLADAWKKVQAAVAAAGGEAPKLAVTWQEALSGVSSAFAEVAQIAGPALSSVVRSIGTVIAQVNQLQKSITAFKSGGAAGMATGLAGAFSFGFGTAATIASISDSMQTPAYVKVMQNIGKEWGIQVSRGMAQQIQASEQSIFTFTMTFNPTQTKEQMAQAQKVLGGKGASEAARALNLSGLIGDAGGLNSKNLDEWAGHAQKLFDIIGLGGTLGQQATTELTKVLGLFADQAKTAGGVWGTAFQSMIGQARELGVGLDTINGLIEDQLSTIASATAKATGGLTGVLSAASKQIDDLTAKQKDQADSGDDSGAAATALQLKTLTQQTVTELQPEFDRLNRITLSSFNAYIAQGHSAVEAIAAVGPAFDSLKESADKFGFAGNDAFNTLSHWRDLTTANQPLLDQVSGLNELMVSLANVGSLDASTFADLQAQGVATFGQLTAAGFDQNEALAQMAPMLQTIKDLHEQNGFAIDDTTQALIDQAEAQGVVKDQEETTQQVLQEGFSALLTALGVDLPAAWKTFTKAGKDAASDVGDALTKIPSPTIKFKYDVPPVPDFPDPRGGGSDGSQPGSTEPGFRWGTPDLDFASFNKSGEQIIAHGDEAIVPKGSGHQLADEIASSLGPRLAGGAPAAAPATNVTLQAHVSVETPDADGMRRLVRSGGLKRELLSMIQDDGAFAAQLSALLPPGSPA